MKTDILLKKIEPWYFYFISNLVDIKEKVYIRTRQKKEYESGAIVTEQRR